MKPAISIRNLLLTQGDFNLAIAKLDLLPHRIYALTGANGAGKSTLLKTIALLTLPQKGTISFPRTKATSLSQQRQIVTLVEQTPYLLSGSVYDNLAFGLKLRQIRGQEQQKRIDHALARVGLDGFKFRKASELSGGEIQRVALARALVLTPQILLLDEPTSNIDSASLEAFEALLGSLPDDGMTVLFSTHDLTQPERLGGEILLIEKGRLIN